MINVDPQPYQDRDYATDIRETVAKLSKLIEEARKHGLKVEVILNNIGKPEWIGFIDAVKISREY